jgi:serine/threonine protein kinase
VFYVQKTVFLVLEYCPFDMHQTFNLKYASPAAASALVLKDEHIKNLMGQILRGLAYLHETQLLMHRVRAI